MQKNLVDGTMFTLAMEPKRPPHKVGGCHLAPLCTWAWPMCHPPRPLLATYWAAPHCEVDPAIMISCCQPWSFPTNISPPPWMVFVHCAFILASSPIWTTEFFLSWMCLRYESLLQSLAARLFSPFARSPLLFLCWAMSTMWMLYVDG